jgi:hypothetical protein
MITVTADDNALANMCGRARVGRALSYELTSSPLPCVPVVDAYRGGAIGFLAPPEFKCSTLVFFFFFLQIYTTYSDYS